MMDLYSTFDWPVLCGEVGKLEVRGAGCGRVVVMGKGRAGVGSE